MKNKLQTLIFFLQVNRQKVENIISFTACTIPFAYIDIKYFLPAAAAYFVMRILATGYTTRQDAGWEDWNEEQACVGAAQRAFPHYFRYDGYILREGEWSHLESLAEVYENIDFEEMTEQEYEQFLQNEYEDLITRHEQIFKEKASHRKDIPESEEI